MFTWRAFWKIDRPATARRAPSRAAYAEALLAGWVPPPAENFSRIASARSSVEEKSDGAAFLARVYVNQRC